MKSKRVYELNNVLNRTEASPREIWRAKGNQSLAYF